jgi:hypothetical protein
MEALCKVEASSTTQDDDQIDESSSPNHHQFVVTRHGWVVKGLCVWWGGRPLSWWCQWADEGTTTTMMEVGMKLQRGVVGSPDCGRRI